MPSGLLKKFGLFIKLQVFNQYILDTAGANVQVLNEVKEILAGFFKIGVLPGTEDKLRLYGDEEIDYDGAY